MKPRPRIVTLICWLLILPSVYQLFKMPVSWRSPEHIESIAGGAVPPDAHFGVVYAGHLLAVIACSLILSGRKIGRLLLAAQVAGWSAYHLFYESFAEGTVIRSLLLAIAALFVFRSNASAFFESAEALRHTGRHR